MSADTLTDFENVFGRRAERSFFAPGRVNVIGEHTDYNGGYVFPCAITIGTYVYAAARLDDTCRFYSGNFLSEGMITFTLADVTYKKEHSWANYPKSLISILQKNGFSLSCGYDIYFIGNIPNGAGLSSSASIELAAAYLFNEWEEWGLSMKQLVLYAQQAENEYIGVQSGIMDQFAIGFGKKGHAMQLDCQSLEYTYAPLPIETHTLLIMNTNKERTLAGSAYNERRKECEEALQILKHHIDIQSLGEVTLNMWEELKYTIEDPTVFKRAAHVITENERTKKAVSALQNQDWKSFGELLNASHDSLKNDYEVTGLELDTLVEAAWQQSGVNGARMTGAGFGGCAIAFVEKEHVDEFIKNVGDLYQDKIGYEASFYPADAGDGVKELKMEGVQG